MSWKDDKAVTADVKRVYQATRQDQALAERECVGQHWDATYTQMAKSWRAHWVNLRTGFEYPPEIRKAIDTTNAMESLNSVIGCATKRRN